MLDPTTSLMSKHFIIQENYDHHDYHNIMYYRTFIYHLI
jgi:hypothetical protein